MWVGVLLQVSPAELPVSCSGISAAACCPFRPTTGVFLHAGLTLHADLSIRTQAIATIKRILRGVPRLRNSMLLGVAGLAARIPDDNPEVHQLDAACTDQI